MRMIWYLYLFVSTIATVMVILYVFLNKKSSKVLRAVVAVLLIVFLVILVRYFIFKNEPFFKIVNIDTSKKLYQKDMLKHQILPLPIEAEPLIKNYLNKMSADKPLLIGVPREVQIKFTDPINPRSPHAIIRVVFENQGNQTAKNIEIKWNIIDKGDRKITAPDEWYQIAEGTKQKAIASLNPKQGFVYIYGPEIGAYAETEPPDLTIILNITYSDESGNEYKYYLKSKTMLKSSSDGKYFFEILDVR